MSERMSDEELRVDVQVVATMLCSIAYSKQERTSLDRIGREALRAREAEARLRDVLESVKAALGDRLLAGGPLSKKYAHAVMAEIQEVLR